jgi:hypothetical protein
MTHDRDQPVAARARQLLPPSFRRAAARFVAARRTTAIERQLASIAAGDAPIVAGPWLGEVGFELLYWIPFLRWFTERFHVSRDRLIVVARGGSGDAWYSSIAGRTYDALTFMTADEFKRRNADRTDRLGEQKQIAETPLDHDLLAFVRRSEGRAVSALHPALMFRLYSPYWWGHQPLDWVRRYARYSLLAPPDLPADLPPDYTAVKFYFNDCFHDTPANRRFVHRVVEALGKQRPVISLSTGVTVDEHDPCEPDVAGMRGVRHLLSPQNNLLVQSSIVGGARQFVGTYGGFAYLAPLCGVPAVTYYSEPGGYSMRHLDLIRDVLMSSGRSDLLEVVELPQEGAS